MVGVENKRDYQQDVVDLRRPPRRAVAAAAAAAAAAENPSSGNRPLAIHVPKRYNNPFPTLTLTNI